MATDDNVTETKPETTTTEENQQKTEETTTAVPQVTDTAKLDEFLASLNTKIDEITKSYDKKLSDMKEQLDAKIQENEKLKNVNAQILMNTSVSKANNEIDFNEVDFDDVDWNKEASSYMKTVDVKIF